MNDRVSVCPRGTVAVKHSSAATWSFTAPAITAPGRYWFRFYLQGRDVSPHFDRGLLVTSSPLNITVLPSEASAAQTTFTTSLNGSVAMAGSLITIQMRTHDRFGNTIPTDAVNVTEWQPVWTPGDRRRQLATASGGAATVWLDSSERRCAARPNLDGAFQLVPSAAANSSDRYWMLHAVVGGHDVAGSPQRLQIFPVSCVAESACENADQQPCASLGDQWVPCRGSCIARTVCGPCDLLGMSIAACGNEEDLPASVCYEDVDECASAPCRHGTCQAGFFDFSCVCFPGWTGELCEVDVDECQLNPCQNEGVCTSSETGEVALVSAGCVARAKCAGDDECTAVGAGWHMCADGCVRSDPWCEDRDPCVQSLGPLFMTCSKWGLRSPNNFTATRRTLQSDLDMVAAPELAFAPPVTDTGSSRNSSGDVLRRLQDSASADSGGCISKSACDEDPCESIQGFQFCRQGTSCVPRRACDPCPERVGEGFVEDCVLRVESCAATPVALTVPLMHKLAAEYMTSPTTLDWGGIPGYWSCCEVEEQLSWMECTNDPAGADGFTITTNLTCAGSAQDCVAIRDANFVWRYLDSWPSYVQSNSFSFEYDPEPCRASDLSSACELVGMVPCGTFCVPRPAGRWQVVRMLEQGWYSTARKHCDPAGNVVASFDACESVRCDCSHQPRGALEFDDCCVCGGNGTSCLDLQEQTAIIESGSGSYSFDESSSWRSSDSSWAEADDNGSGSYEASESWSSSGSASGSWLSETDSSSSATPDALVDHCIPVAGDCLGGTGEDRCRALGASFASCSLSPAAAVVGISFALDLSVVAESAEALATFKHSVENEIAASLGIAPGRVRVVSVEAGSIVVVVEIVAAAAGSPEPSPIAAALALQQQLQDPSSSIRDGSAVFGAAVGVVSMSVRTQGGAGSPGDNNSSAIAFDCAGVVGGVATMDRCGQCDSDSATDCVEDCAGVWGGSLSLDRCGECGGADSCVDCAGVPFGGALVDACGSCGGNQDDPHDCDGPQRLQVSTDSMISGSRAHSSGVAGGDAAGSAADFTGVLSLLAVCVAGALVAMAVMCALVPHWLPARSGASDRLPCCTQACAQVRSCIMWLPRACRQKRARHSAKVSAAVRRKPYVWYSGSDSDEDGHAPVDAAEARRVIAKAGVKKEWRVHTPELHAPPQGLLPPLDPISAQVMEQIDWVKARSFVEDDAGDQRDSRRGGGRGRAKRRGRAR